MQVGTYQGYKIFVTNKPGKKYYALVGKKKVYFGGDPRKYEHFYDKMGYYSNLNHNDKERRKRYKQRHEKYRHIVGSPSWLSDQILW